MEIREEFSGSGHMIYVINRRGEVVHRFRHYPWFVADQPIRADGITVTDVKKLDGLMLTYNEHSHTYAPTANPYKILVSYKKKVPDIAKLVSSLARTKARAGLYNITYEVRVAYDLQSEGWGLLGFETPAVILPNREMVEVVEAGIDKIEDLKVLAFDIEIYSPRGGFPSKGDPIISITYGVMRLDEDIFNPDWPRENIQYILNQARDVDGMIIESRRMVRVLHDVIQREMPDIIVTYNGVGFDIPYLRPHNTLSYFSLENDFIGLRRDGLRFIPHIDLMVMRDSMGSSLGLRSHAAYALDDVVHEVLSTVSKYKDVGWLLNSRFFEAERSLDHARLKEYFDRGDRLFYDYIVADVYFTLILARLWLYPLLLLATLTGIPATVLHRLNTGQVSEYMMTEILRRLGFYPELRHRTYKYSRVTVLPSQVKEMVDDAWVFGLGKVYEYDFGYYGGGDKYIIELDFAQLYPTDMVVNTSDPTSQFIIDRFEVANGSIKRGKSTLTAPKLRIYERAAWVLLQRDDILEFHKLVPGYGPISWLVYKLYAARWETKKIKKRARKEGRPELEGPDQAVKILINAFYGAYSKPRGNLVNELLSAGVFWRTQKLLYQVIRYIDEELGPKLGVKVLYGDTDSTFILAPRGVDPKKLEEEVNKWIHERYGPLYKMELEDTYDAMIIPKQKHGGRVSAKSYILLKDGDIAKFKGEFFKVEAPLAIKDRIKEFYMRVITEAKTKDDVKNIVRDMLREEPLYKWFIKKSVRSYIASDPSKLKSLSSGTSKNEQDTVTVRLKNLNRTAHYAGLVMLCEQKAPGTSIMNVDRPTLDEFTEKGRLVRCRVEPRVVEETQRAVIVSYLPHTVKNPRKFLLLMKDEGDRVRVLDVIVTKVEKERKGATERDMVEVAYIIEYVRREDVYARDELEPVVLMRLNRVFLDMIYKKLLPAMRKRDEGHGPLNIATT